METNSAYKNLNRKKARLSSRTFRNTKRTQGPIFLFVGKGHGDGEVVSAAETAMYEAKNDKQNEQRHTPQRRTTRRNE